MITVRFSGTILALITPDLAHAKDRAMRYQLLTRIIDRYGNSTGPVTRPMKALLAIPGMLSAFVCEYLISE